MSSAENDCFGDKCKVFKRVSNKRSEINVIRDSLESAHE